MDISDFFTRETASRGIKVPLSLPDGSATDYHLMIRGIDSDEWRTAERESKRQLIEISALEDNQAREAAYAKAEIKLLCALVISWNLNSDFTPENVERFLTEAPQVRDQINRIAGDRQLFFAKRLSNSTPTPRQKSRSTKGRKAQKSP